MRKLSLTIPLVVLAFGGESLSAAQQPTRLKGASLESHEGMTISVQPWMDAALYKEKFPKKSPFNAGVLAVEVAFRNDSDESVKVDLERIRLSVRIDEDNRQQLEPLTAEQVADVTLAPGKKDPTARRRLPFPTGGGGPKVGRDKNWTELQTAAENAAVPSSVIAPHSTVKGLLYFDMQGQFDLLNTAQLYVPSLVSLEKGRSLLYFEIDLSHPGST